LNSKKLFETNQNEMVFYSEFREEILTLSVHSNRIYFTGVSSYGVIDIYEALSKKSESQNFEFISKFKAKLCFEKFFTNILSRRVLHFNE
jgi:hypothetical protein